MSMVVRARIKNSKVGAKASYTVTVALKLLALQKSGGGAGIVCMSYNWQGDLQI